jgi:putative SOS response-associated peptidase YedK
MCGRFVMLTAEEVAEVVAAVESRMRPMLAVGAERAQARPGSTIPLIEPNPADGALRAAEAAWGFEAEWSSKLLFNTRVESAVKGSNTWRDAVRDGRCIIPAAAFFEPHATETVRSARTGRPVKRAYRFALPSGEPLLFAGVQANGRCSIVTCEPNRWVSPVHNRMPLILRFEEVTTWLSPDWPALADRGSIELTVQPEHPDDPAPTGQLALF